ncbi:G0/G1 switch protein 2 [Heterocephalus glaber]|uniref:G0/G1 switch protein 2 n=1 Tax=Heterocephalus glaber TaxID=10181 RepID=A0AAX6PXG5_HETGA|nr:G0/G1 switch protein 2 [Heterocephalus glaber]
MDAVHALLPLARDLAAQKPTGRQVKLYALGGLLALVGAVLGLLETVCGPFAAASRLRDQEAAVAELRAARESQAPRTQAARDEARGPELCGRAPSPASSPPGPGFGARGAGLRREDPSHALLSAGACS